MDSSRSAEQPLLSYSQNAEDVRLWRVFHDVDRGFYVDIGAGDPTEGSVTRLFYDRGWSGINVEPSPVFETLRDARPRDVNIRAAVGERDGRVPFFVTYPDLGMSTVELSTHAHVPHAVERYEQTSVPQHRLETILRNHAGGKTIHFLKVDVEGAERQVLASSDWDMFRPLVVVVEAVKSWSTSPTHQEWEGILRSAGYTFAAFDGVNRFYVVHTRDDLVAELAYPVSALDRFVPAGLHQSQAGASLVRAELDQLRGRFEEVTLERDRFVIENAQLEVELQHLRVHVEDLRTASSRLETETIEAREQLAAVIQSRTWRAGRVVAKAGSPALTIARSLRAVRKRLEREITPRRAYALATSDGQPWHFPKRGAVAKPSATTALDRLIRAMGAPKERIDAKRASRLAGEIERTGWADETSLLDGNLSWKERGAVVEADAVVGLVEAEARSGDEPARSGSSLGNGPLLVADARCLQDPAYRSRGVGLHARAVLAAAARAADGLSMVLLTSAELPALDRDITDLAEHVIDTPYPIRDADVALFVELSPMTASMAPTVPFLAARRCRTAAVVYDFIPTEYPAAYLTTAGSRVANRARIEALRHYDVLLPISHATADECREIVGREVRLVVTGVADPLRDVVAVPLGVHEPFVLAPGGGDARKNCAAAVAALAIHMRRRAWPLRVVVTGHLMESQSLALQTLARDLGLPDEALELPGSVAPDELASLYQKASLVFVGSLAEGFSIPVAEALSSGTPVVASDIPPHRELLGAGPWLGSARDVESLADAITYVVDHPEHVAELQGAALADSTDPDAVAQRLTNALSSLLSIRRAARTARAAAPLRPRLAVVSPLPPQRSGVADYTAFTFREVAKHADVDLYSGADLVSPDFRVHAFSASPFIDRRFDSVVNVVGNSHFHFPVLDLMAAFGGACIAHDDRMIEAYGHDRGGDWTASLLSRHRPVRPEQLTELLLDLDQLPSIGYDLLAQQATPLIVHSRALAQRIEAETNVRPVVLPFVPYNLPAAATLDETVRLRARTELGLAENVFHLGMFGIVDRRTKGADLVVGALAWLLSWRVSAHLHVVGAIPHGDRLPLEKLVDELELSPSVTFHGRVPRETLNRYLLAVDVAVQIRTSTMLSLSGSLADCIAYGIPTVTTADMAEELDAPQAYTSSVESRTSSLLIAEAVERLLTARSEQAPLIESERQAYLERRSATSYARGLLRALGVAPE